METDAIVADLQARLTAAEQRVEVLLASLEDAYDVLKEAGSLYVLGYNVRHSEDGNSPDESGVTHAEYERHAKELRGRIHAERCKVRDVLRAAPECILAQPQQEQA